MQVTSEKFSWQNDFGVAVDDYIKGLQLKDWEVGLLWRVLTIADTVELSPEVAVEQCRDFLSIMRGEPDNFPALSFAELSGLTVDNELLSDSNFTRRLLRTVYFIINYGDINLAGVLRAKLEDASGGDLSFSTLEESEQKDFYRALYLELCFEFMDSVPENKQLFLLSSDLFPLIVRLRYSVAEALAKYLDSYTMFSRRMDLSLDYAAFLLINDTSVGERSGEPVPLMKWMELFRTYSQETLGAMELMKFLDDDTYAGQCTQGEKEIIRAYIELYVRLVSGALAVPGGDLDAIEADALKMMKNTIKTGPNWYYIINSPAVAENQRIEIREYLENEIDGGATAQKIKTAIAKILDWNLGHKLDNILTINDLYEQHFGAKAEPLVYFDEASGKFVLSK
ncbi:MAG: hypothetical protein WCT40_00765 [Candidatus Magasanikbacteria bacterium]|jgi:hypothetical protein